MNIRAAISNAPSLNAFRTEAQKGEAVALKKDGLQAQPAKQSFFSRVMQWVRGENSSRINSDTKEAFVAALSREFGTKAADTALAQAGFYGGNDQPLSSREIQFAVSYAKKQAAGGDLAPRSGSGAAGAAQSTMSALTGMLKTRADSVRISQDVKKLGALVVKLQIAKDPRLGVAQKKLDEAKQSLAQIRSQLNGQAAQVASGALPISTAATAVQPSGNSSNAKLNNAQAKRESGAQARELKSEARIQHNAQGAATRAESRQSMQNMRADNKKNREAVREQAKLAREQSRADQQAQRNEQRGAMQAGRLQRSVDRAVQHELRAQARLDRMDGVLQDAKKVLASSENLLRQSSRMVDDEYAALQAEVDALRDNADALSDALARPIGRG